VSNFLAACHHVIDTRPVQSVATSP